MNRLNGVACARCGAAIERASERRFQEGLPVHFRCTPLTVSGRSLAATPIFKLPPEHERLTDHAAAQALVRAAWDAAVEALTREGLYFEQPDAEQPNHKVYRCDAAPTFDHVPAPGEKIPPPFVLTASENLRYELSEPTTAKLRAVLAYDKIKRVLREILARHPGALLSTRLPATVGQSDRLREGRELTFIARVWIYAPAAEEKPA